MPSESPTDSYDGRTRDLPTVNPQHIDIDIDSVTKLLTELAKLQNDTCAIEITIGGTSDSGLVKHNCLTIKKAPPRVFRLLDRIELRYVSIAKGGVHVSF